ncbi:MAG: long-chain-fatty-acid--CoA ligase [Gammaproteobacteria bacterium]|nr:MAG: long-chain-fatty-acid--CoA ligase [Gammaproteobacteria bacterium]
MTRTWLQSYPAGVPAAIDPNLLRSLKELLEKTCALHAENVAYVQMGRTLTYRELDQLSRSFAAWLQNAGFSKGDRLAIMLPNTLQYVIAMFGALRAGVVVVNTNPLYTAPELEHQLADSGATAILVLENFAHVVEKVVPRTSVRQVLVTAVGDFLSFPKSWIVNYVIRHVRKQVPRWQINGAISFRSTVMARTRLPLQPVDVGPDDLAYLQYTGGTTGVAKGAMLTHGNVSANILQAEAWLGKIFCGQPSVLITAIPLYHIFALTANCLLFARLGWKNVLIINPRDFPAFLAEMKKYPFTFLSGVNTLFNALLNTPGFEKLDFRELKITLGGGMAVQASVARRWKEVTGKVLTQAWGLTETSPAACINPPSDEFNGSIGLPIPSTDIAIKDDVGKDLDVGQIGEICVRGPQVMRGYWNRPEETAKVMLPDGYLRTGDVGRMDARGFVYIEDRKKDMILVSGFNVYPNEVEAVAVTHPGILEAAAVAQPDEHSGEVVALFVVRKDPGLTARGVIDHCRQSLAAYKVPKHVYFKADLPKSNVGKILRKALREELLKP